MLTAKQIGGHGTTIGVSIHSTSFQRTSRLQEHEPYCEQADSVSSKAESLSTQEISTGQKLRRGFHSSTTHHQVRETCFKMQRTFGLP